MRKPIVQAVKWLWVACVVAAAAAIVFRSRDDIVVMLRQISWTWLSASVLLTMAAKFFLGENARIAAVRSGVRIDFVESFRLYNLSQLGKYLPGSVWQFVGRAAAYRNLGAEYGAIRDALLCESLWIVAGAFATGVLLVGGAVWPILAGSLSPFVAWWLGIGALIGLLLMVVAAIWKRSLLVRYAFLAKPPLRAVLAQAFIWVSLGLAFWLLARACGLTVGPAFAIGLFALGYAVGFLVPIAPAGLGIRDAVLTLGLMPYLPPGEALAVTVMARLVYLFVDLLLGLGQAPLIAALRRLRTAPAAPE